MTVIKAVNNKKPYPSLWIINLAAEELGFLYSFFKPVNIPIFLYESIRSARFRCLKTAVEAAILIASEIKNNTRPIKNNTW